MPRALHLAAFDSQLKWCGRLRDELAARGFDNEVLVPDLRSALSARQIRDAGFDAVRHVTWAELLDEAVAADVVVSSLVGPVTRAFLVDLGERLEGVRRPGPVVVTGWVGLIIDRITAGYLDRCAADVVVVNAADDLAHFRRTAADLQLPADNLLLAGLPFLGPAAPPPRTEIRSVLFADQPTVPSTAAERLFAYTGAVEYARAHPDRRVLLKPRHRPEEDTLHRMRFHPEKLLAGLELPVNFALDYTPVAEQLRGVDLLVTVSSTACLEALDRGCRVALLLDLGVHEKYGNHIFLGSGLLRTWSEITLDDLGTPHPDWLARYFFPRPRTSTQTIVDRVQALLESGERPAAAVRQTDYARTAARFQRLVTPPAGGRTGTRPGARPGAPAVRRPARALRARDFVPPVLHRPAAGAARQLRSTVARLRVSRAA